MPAVAQDKVTAPRRKPLQDYKTLVLNADYRPLSTYPPSLQPMQKMVTKVLNGRVELFEDWGFMIHAGQVSVPAPKIVVLKNFANIYGKPKFNRRNIFLRDRFCCQYCGGKFILGELTYDHVIPRSRGGKTEWNNIVTACVPCNTIKGNSLPNYSGRKKSRCAGQMRPLKEPRQPSNLELLSAGLEFLSADIKGDFGSALYWGVELDP